MNCETLRAGFGHKCLGYLLHFYLTVCIEKLPENVESFKIRHSLIGIALYAFGT